MSNPPEQHRDVQPPGRRRPYFNDMEFISFNETLRRMFESLFSGLEQQYRQLGIGWSGSSVDTAPFQHNFGSPAGQVGVHS